MLKAAVREFAFGIIPSRKTVNGPGAKVYRMMRLLVEDDRTIGGGPNYRRGVELNPATLALQDQFVGYMMRLPSAEQRAEGREMFYDALHLGAKLDSRRRCATSTCCCSARCRRCRNC